MMSQNVILQLVLIILGSSGNLFLDEVCGSEPVVFPTTQPTNQPPSESPTESLTEPPTQPPSSPPVKNAGGLQEYVKFHANDSYIGQLVPCTDDEKVCLRYSLMFNPKMDKCQSLRQGGDGCYLRASRQEFEHGSGHIVGVCQNDEASCGYRQRMAYDGRCYDAKVIKDDICGCDSATTTHFLGGEECRCSPGDPIHVEQPEDEGLCRIPDFRNSYIESRAFYDQPLVTMDKTKGVRLNCSTEQQRCFEQGKVWVAGANGCHNLLKQGPCPDEYVVVIDGRALVKGLDERVTLRGWAETTCMHVRGGCPPEQKRMGFDGKCHGKRDIELWAPGVVQMNAYGVFEVLYYVKAIEYIPIFEGTCRVYFNHIWPPIV